MSRCARGFGAAQITSSKRDIPALAAQLVRANPKVIVVPSAGVAEIVLKYTRTIPIVALAAGQLEAEESV